MDDFEEDIEIDPLGAVKIPNLKKNVDIISQCSLPQIQNFHQKINPRNRRNTVFFNNKAKGSSINSKDTDLLFSESPTSTSSNSPFSTNTDVTSLFPSTNPGLSNTSYSTTNGRGVSPNDEKIHLVKEKIVNSNSIDSLFTYTETLRHNKKGSDITIPKNLQNENPNQNIKLNEESDSFLSPIKMSNSYNIQVPQFDFSNLLDPKIKIKNDQLVGILSSLNAQITKEKMDLDDFLNEAEMHMDSINDITDKLYSHKSYDVNFLREEAIRNVIFQEYALKRCNSLQTCSRYNIQLIDNFMDFLNNESKKAFKYLVPDVDLDTFLSKYLMSYDDPRLELTKLDHHLSCLVTQVEYLKTQSLPPESSSQMKHSQSYSKRNQNINSKPDMPSQMEAAKSVSNSIQPLAFSKQNSIQSVSFTKTNSNLIHPVSFSFQESNSSSSQQISLSNTSSNFDFLEITSNKAKINNDFVIIDDGLGRMKMYKPYGKSDFVSTFLSPERKSGRIIARFLSRINEMTYSDLDMIITAVMPHPSYHIKIRSLLFDLAWQRMDFPFGSVSHLQFPDILDFTPRSLSPPYMRDEYLDTPFNKLNTTYFKLTNKKPQPKNDTIAMNDTTDNKSMDDINNNIHKKDFEYSSSNEIIMNSNQNSSSSNYVSVLDSKSSDYIAESNESLNSQNNQSNDNVNMNNQSSDIIVDQNSNQKIEDHSSAEFVENNDSCTKNTNNEVINSESGSTANDNEEGSLWPFAFTRDYYFAMMCYTNPFTIANRFCEMIQIVANVLQSLAVEVGNEDEDEVEIGFDNIFPVLLTSVYAFGCPGILDALEYCGQFVDFTTDPQQKFAMTHCNGIVEQIRRTRAEDFKRRAKKNKNQLIFAVQK